jgi:hypothetical protein
METGQNIVGSRWGRTARTAVFTAALVLCGVGVWAVAPAQTVIKSDKETATQHFKSGGQISASELKEIAQTLKQIDGRLERMERALLSAVEEGK